MRIDEWAKKLNDHITKWFHDQNLRFLGEVYPSGNDIVIYGQFLEVREIEFRFRPDTNLPDRNAESLRLIRFNSLSGIHISELSLIDTTLKKAIACF